jgi:hypothetical protein
MEKHFLRVAVGDPAETAQQLKQKGVKVLHRFGKTLVVKGEPGPNLTPEVSRLTSSADAGPLAAFPAKVGDDEIALLAFRLRQTEGFRRAKAKRATEGDDWGEILERM